MLPKLKLNITAHGSIYFPALGKVLSEIRGELYSNKLYDISPHYLMVVHAITTPCNIQCEHCFLQAKNYCLKALTLILTLDSV